MSFPARFTRYEIFRILIPGYFFIALLILWSLTLPLQNYTRNIFISNFFVISVLFGGIFAGLVIYSYDYPLKTDFWRENHEYNILANYLKELLCDDCDFICRNIMLSTEEAVPSFFYVQYNLFDTTSQGVIQYFRSVYRVYTNIQFILSGFIYVSFITMGLTTLFSLFFSYNGITAYIPYIMYQGIYTIILVVVLMILIRDNKGQEYLKKAILYQKEYMKIIKEKIIKNICIAKTRE